MSERENSFASVVKSRLESGSRPGERDDGQKVGLVIEGGCLAGVVSGGMTLAVGKHLLETIDAVYGVSAGAAAAAYLLGGDTGAISMYYDFVNSGDFFDPRRAWQGKPVIDIPYLTHKLMKIIRPLDWRRVIGSPIELHILTTEANQAMVADFHHFESQEEILNAIHYSCRIPIIAGRPVVVDSQTAYTDGAVATGGICLAEALLDGCTQVLVLRSGPEDQPSSPRFTPIELVSYFLLREEYPTLAYWLLFCFRKLYHETLLTLEKAKKTDPGIVTIDLPKGSPVFSAFEMNRQKLIRGARLGYYTAAKRIRGMLE